MLVLKLVVGSVIAAGALLLIGILVRFNLKRREIAGVAGDASDVQIQRIYRALEALAGVDPVRWTPDLYGERSPQCQERDRRIRQSSGSRWWSWSMQDVRLRN
jgi:hypothetical protein